MSGGRLALSGAKPMAPTPPPPTLPRPLTNGSSISVEKLIGQLKHRALGAGRGFAVELGQRIAERAAGQAERCWQKSAATCHHC